MVKGIVVVIVAAVALIVGVVTVKKRTNKGTYLKQQQAGAVLWQLLPIYE